MSDQPKFCPEHEGLKESLEGINETLKEIMGNHLKSLEKAAVAAATNVAWLKWLACILFAYFILRHLGAL